MIEKTFTNNELEIELTSYINDKENIWFKGKILGYVDTDQAIRQHVDSEYKKTWSVFSPGQVKNIIMFNESGLYVLVFASKLPAPKKFRDWVLPKVLPSIRKYGQYKLFDNPNSHMFKIENETDVHCKVVHYIRRFILMPLLLPDLAKIKILQKSESVHGEKVI